MLIVDVFVFVFAMLVVLGGLSVDTRTGLIIGPFTKFVYFSVMLIWFLRRMVRLDESLRWKLEGCGGDDWFSPD